MTATPSPSPVFRVTDPATGLAIPGAKVHTYEANSTTDKLTWSDAGETAPHDNPVVMDADGQAQIFIDGTYKFVVTRADDTLLYEIDDVIGGTAVFDRPASGISSLPFDDIVAVNVQAALEELGTKRIKTDDVGLLVTLLAKYLKSAGDIVASAALSAAPGSLECDGTAYSRTAQSALWTAIHREATVTMTIASPGVITWTSHGMQAGDPVHFGTTGALPTGITAGTVYFILAAGLTGNSFRIGATAGGAAINTSGSQSGIHTGYNAPWGAGNGSTTFNVPELRGEWLRGWDGTRGVDAARVFGSAQAEMIGPHTHTITTGTDSVLHTHDVTSINSSHGASLGAPSGWRADNGDQFSGTSYTVTSATQNVTHTHSGTTANNAGTENRVRNKAVRFYIVTGGV